MNGPRLERLAPRGHAFDHATAQPQGRRLAETLGADEVQALDDLDMVHPGQGDLEALDASAKMLDTRPASDDLRLPPPPRRTLAAGTVHRSVGDAIRSFRTRAQQPVAAEPRAIEAEAKMMAACEGICRLQSRLDGERARPRDAFGLQLMGRSL